MKLALKRNQQDIKGTFGGHKGVNFTLTARAIFTPEEERLIDRYKMGGLIVHELILDPETHKRLTVSIDGLKRGTEVALTSIGDMIEMEAQITQGVKNLKAILALAANFGGEEIIEI